MIRQINQLSQVQRHERQVTHTRIPHPPLIQMETRFTTYLTGTTAQIADGKDPTIQVKREVYHMYGLRKEHIKSK